MSPGAEAARDRLLTAMLALQVPLRVPVCIAEARELVAHLDGVAHGLGLARAYERASKARAAAALAWEVYRDLLAEGREQIDAGLDTDGVLTTALLSVGELA
jgi:hypothetical protein